MSSLPAVWEGALLGGLLCGLLSLAVPWVVRTLPEPAPDPDRGEAEPPKPTYAALGSRPGLLPGAALSGLAAGALAGAVVGPGWTLALVVLAVPVCVALAFVDWHTRLLPSRLVLPATGLLLLVVAAEWGVTGDREDPLRALLGLLVARSLFWVLWFVHSAGMGFGDVRLAALLGLVLGHAGWAELVVGVYLPFLLFAVPGVVLALVRRDRGLLRVAYPFGPFMVLGALVGLCLGPAVLGSLTGA
ncbi:A24 family peptidase [Nocardioides sp.]|uniref:prepilin peptidase n=1 Tax=Nocardioides sp. TaxID=35761 RepID=UPI00261DB66B|nr:A24 family peptidase [Nocardioides sp.]